MMEIGSAAITALFVGLIWTLIKVVEFFVSGKKRGLTPEQEQILLYIQGRVKHLDELHSVYDSNHVPKWYVPGELLTLIRETHSALEALSHELDDSMEKVTSGQASSVQKISDLINSQKLMTERLGDLVTLWSKLGSSNK
jgi:hypothetical protein